MKLLPAQIGYLFSRPDTRRNLKAFFRLCVVLLGVIVLFAVLFHLLMVYEGKQHSWLTGFYWTLTVMSTLGFGDITFTSDVGRLFSVIVLLAGVVLLLIVLPFSFIRYFYAPWLEAQIRLRAPRALPEDTRDHVVICHWNSLAEGLVARLVADGVPYAVIEPDASRAAELLSDGIKIVTGEIDARETYERVHVHRARLVLANLDDATNTNITLTVREASATVTIVALAEDTDSIDILQLAGATRVMALKDRLGQHLASRVTAGARHSHLLGHHGGLSIAEFPLRGTPFAGTIVRESGLRAATGLSLVGLWQRGRLQSLGPDTPLSDSSVAVVCGTQEQMSTLDELLAAAPPDDGAVLVIGGGTVGRAALKELRRREVRATVLESDPALEPLLLGLSDRVVIGSGADRRAIDSAGLADAPTVLITTNHDATNVFLTAYCRKLSPRVHLVSRVTHERNIEAIHRAGADLVLSYSDLAVKELMAVVQQAELVMLGAAMDVFELEVTPALRGRTLAESGIGARTGLTVIGVRTEHDDLVPAAGPNTVLTSGGSLVVVGTAEQRRAYEQVYR